MMNLNLAGGGFMMIVAGSGWFIFSLFAVPKAVLVALTLVTIGMVMIGLDVETDDSEDMALDAEDLE